MRDELNVLKLLDQIPELFSYEAICKTSDVDRERYLVLLDHFRKVNGSSASKKEKGVALEELVSFLLKISGNIFTVIRNVYTSTNEIDQLVQLNSKGKALLAHGLVPKRFDFFLGECKNHKTTIGVGHIGKFYSLLQTTQTKTGILFSYHGISGSEWSDGCGLVKKIYLQREKDDDRVAVIDFCIHDFQAIAKGRNFLGIVEDKLNALRFDTSIDTFISQHPAESNLTMITT